MAVANGFCEHTQSSSLLEEGITLSKDLINYKIQHNLPPVNATAKTLRKLSDDIEVQNPDLLEQLCSKLNFSKETGYSSFRDISKQVFSDGIINWGRIVVLFAFGARLGKYCNENNMRDQIENITHWTARFVTELDWIEAHGGWVGSFFCYYINVACRQARTCIKIAKFPHFPSFLFKSLTTQMLFDEAFVKKESVTPNSSHRNLAGVTWQF